jgi:phage FluMu gp28-like protein
MNYPALIAEHVQHLQPSEQKEVMDFILLLEQRARLSKAEMDDEGRGQRLAEALLKLQAAHPFNGISDPVAWQREIRKDRPLPGRD